MWKIISQKGGQPFSRACDCDKMTGGWKRREPEKMIETLGAEPGNIGRRAGENECRRE